VAFHLAAWGDETTADILRSGILAAANEPTAMERLRVSYGRLLDVLAGGLPEKERHLHAGLIASQFLGMAMLRYVWRVGPLVNLSPEELSKLITPIIQRFVNGPLGD
jgi:Tetracyclin repressor-like, C-terminal domain